jgi:site-specific recombinase XerD
MNNWMEEYRDWLVNQGRSEHTISAYTGDVDQYARNFAKVNGHDFTPEELCAPDLREYRAALLTVENLSPATWNRKRASLKVFTVWCQHEHLVDGDPMQGVDPVEVQDLPPYWLNAEDFRRLRRQMDVAVNAAQTPIKRAQAIRNRAMAALILYAGVRPGEVVNLSVSSLLVKERSGTVKIRAGKGQKYAEIPLGDEARKAVSSWLEIRPDGDRLFGITVRQLERELNKLAVSAGVDDFHAHRLRHTFIRRLLVEKNQPAHRVQDLARHSSFRTTKRYAQDGWEDLAAAVEGL